MAWFLNSYSCSKKTTEVSTSSQGWETDQAVSYSQKGTLTYKRWIMPHSPIQSWFKEGEEARTRRQHYFTWFTRYNHESINVKIGWNKLIVRDHFFFFLMWVICLLKNPTKLSNLSLIFTLWIFSFFKQET